MSSIPVYPIHLPEYTLNTTPDYLAIGQKLDELIKQHFPDSWIALRGISLQDHPGKTHDDLIASISKLGTDRYDPTRKGVHHEIDKKFGIELHATPMIARGSELFCPHYSHRLETGSVLGDGLLDCYEGAKVDRGYPLRLDIMTVYDLDQLTPAPMVWKENGPEYNANPINPQETTVFKFKDPNNKPASIKGIIKIL